MTDRELAHLFLGVASVGGRSLDSAGSPSNEARKIASLSAIVSGRREARGDRLILADVIGPPKRASIGDYRYFSRDYPGVFATQYREFR
jgi:hypothetical protein